MSVGAVVCRLQAMNTRDHFPTSTFLDLTRRQVERFSITELISAAARDDRETLRFYAECTDALAQRTGQTPSTHRSHLIPSDVLVRDMQAATGSGAYLVGQQHGFVSGLYNNTLIGALPLRRMPMKDNGALAATTTAPTITWLSDENAEAADANPTFGTRSLVPKSVAVVAHISHQMNAQQPDALPFVEAELGAKMAEAAGTALCQGTGSSGQPTGLLTIANTTSTSGTNLAWSGIRDLLAATEGYSADGLRFLLGVDAAKVLRAREKASGSGMVLADGRIDGYQATVTRCMPVASLLVADFSRVSWATFGNMEITVSPLSSGAAFARGAVGVRLMWHIDFVADHPSIVGKSVSIT